MSNRVLSADGTDVPVHLLGQAAERLDSGAGRPAAAVPGDVCDVQLPDTRDNHAGQPDCATADADPPANNDEHAIAEARAAVIAEARSWTGTNFHLGARIKGVGVDCAQFILACYEVAGIALDIKPVQVSRDWFNHHVDDRFITPIRERAREVDSPEPGDIALFHIGQSWAHGAIVVSWPMAIHAKWNSGVQLVDCSQKELGCLPRKFFSPWGANE